MKVISTKNIKQNKSSIFLAILIIVFSSCISHEPPADLTCDSQVFDYNNQTGCDGKIYPNPNTSPYALPFLPGKNFRTGLTNCSSSYHAPNMPDRYAFDFDVPSGTQFYAAREGTVVEVINDQPSEGGGAGNMVVVKHSDNTFGMYLHSPKDGIVVNINDPVAKGQLLGETGVSGLAGYPHLHFIVVQNDYKWPYSPVPITFKNIVPADVIVKSRSSYMACEY